jgi:isopentenyl-diphosphate Delta-isomerase
MAPRIAVVDANDRFVRWTDRLEIHRLRLPHRSANVLLFDSQGRLLLQRRDEAKATDPGVWDLSASGHVEEDDYLGGPDERLDEVYANVARRELMEELGVSAPLELVGHFAPEPGVHYEQLRLFRGRSDGPFILQPGEVSAIVHVTPAELAARLAGPEPHTKSLRWLAERGIIFSPRS